MVTKKTSQTLAVDDLIGKPQAPKTRVQSETATQAEPAAAPAMAEPAPVARPHRIHIGGERSHDSQSNSNQNQSHQMNTNNNAGGYPPVQNTPTEEVKGFLDSQPEGHGFLRPKFIHSNRDIYISQSQIRRFMLRPGDLVEGVARPPKDTERYYGLLKVEKVNGMPADEAIRRPFFDDLTPIYPDKQVLLATDTTPLRQV